MAKAKRVIGEWEVGIEMKVSMRRLIRRKASKRRKVSENDKECGGILFFERKGKLLGIDLSKQKSLRWDLKEPSSPSPPPLPLTCTADTPIPRAPCPPFYVQFFDNLRQDSSLDSRFCPVYRSFVVDDKFFIIYDDPSCRFLLYCFNSSLKKWQKLPTHGYPDAVGRFWYFWCPSHCCSELWLPEYGLSLALEIPYLPFLYDNSYVFFQAVAIIYSQGGNAPALPREKQLLDEVFSGMFPAVPDPDCSVEATAHFLDLGKMDDQTKRICAVVSAYNCGQAYLFISIFDVQMGDPRPPNLLKVSVVKKLVYKLGDEAEFSRLYTVFVV
ncbi:hypothetical protein RJT34_04896 [Clitoria ternatea]|uniref:Uncharacterized protein n=1 Tax=Clitoria ternatea TaxID=43366 RepID=A0AAN9Q325_CLITE